MSGSLAAHEFTPTYPKLRQSYVENVLYTEMSLFNARPDVEYYSVRVFDESWNKVPYAVKSSIVKIKYLERKKIKVFIRAKDKDRATYVCSRSKIVASGSSKTSIESRICSKFK